MISAITQIIGRLSGNHVLVAKEQNPDSPYSGRQRAIEQLKMRDKDVRAHEAAHTSNPDLVTVGAAQYDYTIGPDGKAYATGGRVTLSTGNARTPQEALVKAEALKKASMAPGSPSSHDFQALNAAISMESEALNLIYNEKKIFNGSPSQIKGMNLNLYA